MRGPKSQRGFGLVLLVAVAGIIAFTLTVTLAHRFTWEAKLSREGEIATWVESARKDLWAAYRQHSKTLDYSDPIATGVVPASCLSEFTSEPEQLGCHLMALAGLKPMYGARTVLSPTFVTGTGDFAVQYRRGVAWVPSSDVVMDDGAVLAQFRATGEFNPCLGSPSGGGDCTKQVWVDFDTRQLQSEMLLQTHRRLETVAFKAQAYFQARMLQDPERNVQVNYFRPLAGCASTAESTPGIDLPCTGLNAGFDPLLLTDSTGAVLTDAHGLPFRAPMAERLSLSSSEVASPWGLPIEVSNETNPGVTGPGLSAETQPPYSLVFRVRTPGGQYIVMRAIQQF